MIIKHKKVGIVVSRSDKTVYVLVERFVTHKKYKKKYRVSKKFAAHDEKNESKIGDLVQIVETRPISKLKRWKIVNKTI